MKKILLTICISATLISGCGCSSDTQKQKQVARPTEKAEHSVSPTEKATSATPSSSIITPTVSPTQKPTATPSPVSTPSPTASNISNSSSSKVVKPTSKTVAAEKDSYNEQYVYVGETGTKYHRYSCSTLRKDKYKISLKQAKSENRTACKVCKP